LGRLRLAAFGRSLTLAVDDDAPPSPTCPACGQATLARVVDWFGKCPSWRAIWPFDSS
jgi:hypothetical protein